MKTGIEIIAEERNRQIEQEGWTAEHDDAHAKGEIGAAAICYTRRAVLICAGEANPITSHYPWPWDSHWWKPSPEPLRNLAKAGALIAAEIDRLQRLAKPE